MQSEQLWQPLQDLKLLIGFKSSDNHLSALDGIRALSLLWVFSLHAMLLEAWDVETQKRRVGPEAEVFQDVKLSAWAQLPLHGNTGMDSFFVLSGLLISRGYQGMKSRSCLRRYGTFLVRRIFRIWPMVVAAVAASLLIGVLVPACPLSARVPWVWTHLLLVQNLFVDSLKNPDLPQLWSVGVEMQMYLITPLLMDLMVDRKTSQMRSFAPLYLTVLSLLSVAFRCWLILGSPQEAVDRAWPPGMVYLNPLARLSPYISGMAVQLAMNTIDTRRISGHPLRHVLVMMLDLCAVSILLLAAFIGQKPEPAPSFMYELFEPLVVKLIVALWPPVYGWCLARVIFRVLSIEKPKDGGVLSQLHPWFLLQCFLSSQLWKGLALLSYSAYVVQQFVLLLILAPLMKELHLYWSGLNTPGDALWRYAVVFSLFVLMACLIALPFHLFIEKPCIRLGRYLSTERAHQVEECTLDTEAPDAPVAPSDPQLARC